MPPVPPPPCNCSNFCDGLASGALLTCEDGTTVPILKMNDTVRVLTSSPNVVFPFWETPAVLFANLMTSLSEMASGFGQVGDSAVEAKHDSTCKTAEFLRHLATLARVYSEQERLKLTAQAAVSNLAALLPDDQSP